MRQVRRSENVVGEYYARTIMQGMLGKTRKAESVSGSSKRGTRAVDKGKDGPKRGRRPNKGTKRQRLTKEDAALVRAKLRGRKNPIPAADVPPPKPKRQSLVSKWLSGLLSANNKDMPLEDITTAAKRAKQNMEQVEIAANELRVVRYWPFSTGTAGPQYWRMD